MVRQCNRLVHGFICCANIGKDSGLFFLVFGEEAVVNEFQEYFFCDFAFVHRMTAFRECCARRSAGIIPRGEGVRKEEGNMSTDEKEKTAQMLEHLNRQMDEVIRKLDCLHKIQLAAILYHENPKSGPFQDIGESAPGEGPESSGSRREDTGRKLEDSFPSIQMIRFPYGGLDRDTHEVVNADAFSKFRNQADFSNL